MGAHCPIENRPGTNAARHSTRRGQTWTAAAVLAGALLTLGLSEDRRVSRAQQPGDARSGPGAADLAPTVHPAVPRDPTRLWLVPRGDEGIRTAAGSGPASTLARFAEGVKLLTAGNHAQALPLVSAPALVSTPLADYAAYYTGLAQHRLDSLDAARRTFAALGARRPAGYLSEAATLREAEVAEAQGDHAAAAQLYESLLDRKTTAPDELLLGLARAAGAAGDRRRAADTYLRLYYEHPISDLAEQAGSAIERSGEVEPVSAGSTRYRLELARAERLFAARKFPEAWRAFELLRPHTGADDRELVALRLAECDYYQGRHRAAREALRPYIDTASRRAEALFFYLLATRRLGQHDDYLALARRLVAEFPDSSWAEDTLNDVGTFYVLENDDATAAGVFAELYQRFPSGRHAERAAWKAGWWAYKQINYQETIRHFESAAATFPRSDYRPLFLYWAARAHDVLGNRDLANARYQLVATDYLHSYYGRRAAQLLRERRATAPAAPGSGAGARADQAAAHPPTEELIRTLLSLELYDDGLNELLFAQRTWGSSPAIDATTAWVYNRLGDLRRAITLMKRAYPQYLSAQGDGLPPDVREVLFPMRYWDLIKKHAQARGLDPYLMAALVAQESTFIPDIRSSANAYGLMQVVPKTGRRYAGRLGVRRFRTSMLTDPTINVRLGTAILADLLKRFGSVHLALAGYNAGDHRVVRWLAERPGLTEDEFIDDIPFPETQNYVKKVLGMAEDYRRLYGSAPRSRSKVAAQAPAQP